MQGSNINNNTMLKVHFYPRKRAAPPYWCWWNQSTGWDVYSGDLSLATLTQSLFDEYLLGARYLEETHSFFCIFG